MTWAILASWLLPTQPAPMTPAAPTSTGCTTVVAPAVDSPSTVALLAGSTLLWVAVFVAALAAAVWIERSVS